MGVSSQRGALEETGRVWCRQVLSLSELEALDALCIAGKPGVRRNLDAATLEVIGAVDRVARDVLGQSGPIRVVAFDKDEENNWSLPWHQDRVVAVKGKEDVEGFSNWTQKAGVWHAEPPIELLTEMTFARVHLDRADRDNGCLQLALGTHGRGKIAASDAASVAEGSEIEHCVAERGDILFAKALILHRSAASFSSAPRRALRIDYCAESLPAPLRWEAA